MKMNNTKSKPLVIIQCYEDRQQTLPRRKSDQPQAGTGNSHPQPKQETADTPPPPPPMPSINGLQNGEHKKIMNGQTPAPKQIMAQNGDHKIINGHKLLNKPIVADFVANLNLRNSGTLTRTPTPDYNKKTEPAIQSKKAKDEKAELESLESYKLKNPSNLQPKPPSNYFVKAPNGTATMKKHVRPVSVTIGEYAYSGGSRREPTKLDFLNGDKPDGLAADDEVSISNRLQSELAMTLSRSNLRKKTEALVDASR